MTNLFKNILNDDNYEKHFEYLKNRYENERKSIYKSINWYLVGCSCLKGKRNVTLSHFSSIYKVFENSYGIVLISTTIIFILLKPDPSYVKWMIEYKEAKEKILEYAENGFPLKLSITYFDSGQKILFKMIEKKLYYIMYVQ